MSRVSRLTEQFEELKDQSIIVEYTFMQPNWLVILNLNLELFLNNKEASAFIDGAKAGYMYGR